MGNYPRWLGLKHFANVENITFTDADQYMDILKVSSEKLRVNMLYHVLKRIQCILPCICQLLGKDSPLVHCIRAYQQFCIMVGMTVMTADRLERLQTYLDSYDVYCSVCRSANAFPAFLSLLFSFAGDLVHGRTCKGV
jgi:hypothetical protein